LVADYSLLDPIQNRYKKQEKIRSEKI